MKFYFAPLEGITGYIYRNAYHEYFDSGIKKYFTPFLAVNQKGLLKYRELEDISPDHNRGMKTIPQLLGNNGGQMTDYLYRLREMGYQEVNINLGCPYQTVVAKKKGAGLLADTDLLKEFLDGVFSDAPVAVSVKTRIGMERPEEFEVLLEIYNQYPIAELIVHPRVRADFYGNRPDWDAFALALDQSRAPLCYNGDIFTVKDYEAFTMRFPGVDRIMLGRGLLANPGLPAEIMTGRKPEKEALKNFHNRIYTDYRKIMSGDKNTLFKMKELWNYMQFLFEDCEKHIKKIRKAKTAEEYEAAVDALFGLCRLKEEGGFETGI